MIVVLFAVLCKIEIVYRQPKYEREAQARDPQIDYGAQGHFRWQRGEAHQVGEVCVPAVGVVLERVSC